MDSQQKELTLEDDLERIPEKLSVGAKVIVLRRAITGPPADGQIQVVPADGVVRVVIPTATPDWYQYVVYHPDDDTTAVYDAGSVKPATWVSLSELVSSPENVRDEWQDSLKTMRMTESELSFEEWLELRFGMADYILGGLVSMIDLEQLHPSISRMLDLYYNSGEPEIEEAVTSLLPCDEFPTSEQEPDDDEI